MYRTMQRGAGSLSGCMVDATGLDDKTRVSLWVGLLGLSPDRPEAPLSVLKSPYVLCGSLARRP